MEKKTGVQIQLLLTFVVLTVALYSLFDNRRNYYHQQQLQLLTERYQLAYNTIFDQYRKLATNVCSGIIERYNIPDMYQKLLTADEEKKNRLRAELLAQIRPRYEELKKAGSVRQLHFHLRNNDSFLRLHRPGRYGDNLTGIRETVNYVNTEHLPIDGFEEGRIFNGYRFVFPITAADQTHLGSVEISFGPEAMTGSMMKQYVVLSNFFIKEAIVKSKLFPDEIGKNYQKSHHKGYLYDNNVLAALKGVSRKEMKELKPQQATIDALFANAHSGQAMSLYDRFTNMVFTTIPVFNPVTHEMVAIFTVRSQSIFFAKTTQHFRLVFSLTLLLLGTVLSTFYMQYSKRKILEASTKQLEKQRQQLLGSQKIANLGHWELDHRTRELSWSDQTSRIFDLESEDFAGTYEAFLEKIHPDDRDYVKAAYKKALKTHQPCNVQHRIITADGTEKWVRGTCITRYDERGRPLTSLGISHDITEQHNTLTLLQRERDMFMSGPVVTFTWQNCENWPVEQISPNIIDILGYSKEEFLDGSVIYTELIHPDDLQRVTGEVARNSNPDNSSFIHEPYRLIRRDGEAIWVLDCTTLIRNTQGDITHYQGYLIDITKMIEMEEEVVSTKNLLRISQYEEQRKRFESLKTMAGAVAHRFNNAMTVVQGKLELLTLNLSEGSDEQKMASDAEQAARGAAQVGAMMLTYVGQQPLQLQELSLADLAGESVKAVKSLLQPSITLVFTPPVRPLYCSVDQKQIKEVIENILVNAVESLDNATGTIEITFGSDFFSRSSFPIPFQDNMLKDGSYAFCQIMDSGHGIDPENLLQIFEPFYTTRFVGRGLGLALTVGVMRAHHGAVTVKSDPGVGTTVRVLLPSIPLSQPRLSSSGEVRSAAVQLSGDILLADDETAVLDVGRRFLELLGFTVHTAVNGQEAVEKILRKDINFCAVVMDISMPEIDGISAMKAIRKIDPVIPVLLSSGYSEESFSFKEDPENMPDGFLEKPFHLSDMQGSLEKLLS